MEEQKKEEKVVRRGVTRFILLLIIVCLILAIAYVLNIQRRDTIFELTGQKNEVFEVGTKYIEKGIVASFKDKDISDLVNISSNVNMKKVGNYKVVYNLKIPYMFLDKTIVRQVHVIDNIKPDLKINSENEVNICIGEEYTYPTCIAIDNYDGDITQKVKIETDLDTKKAGTYNVNYCVNDSNNNVATNKVVVNVINKKPYIIVSISKQTLSYYEYDKLVLSSDIVTGINSKTPIGTFKVLNKARDIILKGKDYESFVSYWIAFKGVSFGFHDASWRSNFGGKIYKTNGSHGCVNMPYSKVKKLYNIVQIGTPVYIKK